MKDIINDVLDYLKTKHVSYGDVRVVREKSENFHAKNGHPENISANSSDGFGVRVIVDGAWGFASSSRITKDEMHRIADEAVGIAKTSARFKTDDVTLAPQEPVIDDWENPYDEDPFSVPMNERMDLLVDASERILDAEEEVKIAEGFMSFFFTDKVFANTEGAFVTQRLTESGGGITATAVGEDDVQTRSYPNSFRGNFGAVGYEAIREMDVLAQCERVAAEAVQLLKAKVCPTRVTDIVIDGTMMALQVHESCGHPSELDRVLGMEASYAGGSFLQPDLLGNFKYGSDIVNIVGDATAPGGLGTFGYDDDGVPAQRFDIIKDGVFVGYLSNRETAPALGPDARSTGANRADGWNRIPLVRMTNINLLPGEGTLEELIAGIDDGLYLETNRAWSIDDKRVNFQFTTEWAREIKNGKLGDPVKNATYTAKTTDFWNACDAIGGPEEWAMWGTPNCGKGEPSQTMHVGHGTSPARFRGIQVRQA
ncbi:MAG: TldD/PmbA family protein [Candidatus Coatesbacteria bacterium]|nr:MAG: TldD/PmbA family protein [Candidatus Coatesbacteria bacterium]